MTPPIDPWKHRRRIIYATLIFCAVTVGYLVFEAPSDSLREHLALALTGLAGSVIGAYVFGAAWDDRNKRQYPEPTEEPDDRPKDADV